MSFWNKLSQKEKIGLSFALGVMLIACLDRLIINPIRSRFQQIEQQIRISEKQLGHDLRNVHLKEQIEEEFEKYVEYVERSGSDEEEVAKILGEIESLARQSQVYLVDVKPQTPKTIDFYKQYAVEIETEGEIDAIMTFLHHINTSRQLLRAEKLRLSVNEDDKNILKSSILITKVLVQ
jgi:Tfp pilus assembly protein PilO